MIPFFDQDHMMIFNNEQLDLMKHVSVTFFKYHHHTQEDHARYFSEGLILKQEGLAWGVYTDE